MRSKGLVAVLAGLLVFAVFAFYVPSAQAVNINSDGSISGTSNIRCDGNVYTLTGDVLYTIRIGRSNIVLDGAGYTVRPDNTVEAKGTGLLLLPGVNGVTIKNLNIKDFVGGMTLKGKDNAVSDCTIKDCSSGIWLNEAQGNIIKDNVYVNLNPGVRFSDSSGNQLRNNQFINSSIFTGIDTEPNDIDPSNTIDGKPIHYIVNQSGLVISPKDYPEIGYLALVDCANMTVRDLQLSGSPTSVGIILRGTTNSTITHNYLSNFWQGISSTDSYGNLIMENYFKNNQEFALSISATTPNTITNNTFEDNKVGIYISGSNQIIYHNNFLNNTKHVDSADWSPLNRLDPSYAVHVWDNGYPSGGNYWSGINATDADGDGIYDEAYVLTSGNRANMDRYPLAQPAVTSEFTEASGSATEIPPSFPILPLLIAIACAATIAIGAFAVYRAKRKPTFGGLS
ncbi:MAG: NosD domain-containing protein [Candidatus Bathyarchaeia archaeon]